MVEALWGFESRTGQEQSGSFLPLCLKLLPRTGSTSLMAGKPSDSSKESCIGFAQIPEKKGSAVVLTGERGKL